MAVAAHAGRLGPPGSPDAPIASLLALLASTIGLPFVVLAATSPLLQAWFARLRPGASPFWLFALSNAGSLAGLASYPLVVEPLLTVRTQGGLWAAGFGLYAVGLTACAVAAGGGPGSAEASRRGWRAVPVFASASSGWRSPSSPR